MPLPPTADIQITRAVGTIEAVVGDRNNLYLTFQSVGIRLHPMVSREFAQVLSRGQQTAVCLKRPGTSRALVLVRSGQPPVFFFTRDPLFRHLKAVPR